VTFHQDAGDRRVRRQGQGPPEEQAEFVAARPGTRHILLSSGSHDAHLDATGERAKTLRTTLT